MKITDLLFESKKKKEQSGKKLNRDIFVYLPPKEPKDEFAQCSSCRLYLPKQERCAIMGPSIHVPPEASCGLYIHGEPSEDQICEPVVKPKDAGLVRRQVRCENCISFTDTKCKLYEMLNVLKPDIFDLDVTVEAKGCCNSQSPKSDH